MSVRPLDREDAAKKFGAIDFAAGIWPKEHSFLMMAVIPDGWFPDWKVLDTQIPVKHFLVNQDMLTPLMAALHAVKDRGVNPLLLKTFDGCFNIRAVRGSQTHFSWHSYALALDFNAGENPLGAESGGFYDAPAFVKCFTDFGFLWGGNFHARKDPMHFQYAIG